MLTVFLILSISSFSTFSIFQSAGIFAIPNRKRLSVAMPRSLCCTSGWYCSPYSCCCLFSIATIVPCAFATQASAYSCLYSTLIDLYISSLPANIHFLQALPAACKKF